jgi:hypothetical protein
MIRLRPTPWRFLAFVVAVAALAIALAACGSSSGGSSTGSTSETAEVAGGAVTHSVAEEDGEEEAGEGEESAESELDHIILIQIYGKFGGNAHEYHLVEGGSCKILKVNVSPAAVKADSGAILNAEKTASVEVAPLKGASMRHCREAAESAIG